MAEGDEDRTEAATPRRLQRARESGSVALSREVPALAGMAGGLGVLMLAGPGLVQGFTRRLAILLGALDADPKAALWATCSAVMALFAPVALGVIVASAASVLLQTGFLLTPGALMPKLSRLDPKAGLSRIVGPAGLVEAAKSLVKLAVLAFAAFFVLRRALPAIGVAVDWLPDQLAGRATAAATALVLAVCGAQAVIAGADLVWVRIKHARDLRMSREEVKQDNKDADGNPQIKGRLRALRQKRARQRMMAAIPTATVVVTNPTHYAVALAYDRARGGAPRVVAKGADEVAARIREMAAKHRVPLVANPPVARALFQVELDAEIPAEHFKAVAEIIAYVWRLRGRAAR